MAEDFEGLSFELPEELEDLNIEQISEATISEIARETLKKRTGKHNEKVLERAEDMEGAEKASFIRRKFVTGLGAISVSPPGTPYQDVVNKMVVTKTTKGWSVAAKRTYASGRVGREIHYPLNV